MSAARESLEELAEAWIAQLREHGAHYGNVDEMIAMVRGRLLIEAARMAEERPHVASRLHLSMARRAAEEFFLSVGSFMAEAPPLRRVAGRS